MHHWPRGMDAPAPLQIFLTDAHNYTGSQPSAQVDNCIVLYICLSHYDLIIGALNVKRARKKRIKSTGYPQTMLPLSCVHAHRS